MTNFCLLWCASPTLSDRFFEALPQAGTDPHRARSCFWKEFWEVSRGLVATKKGCGAF